ncbi:hypothetical protein [Leucothrix mucor]|uniref:hypothetical protein n=1 Tax=Leucothrix mucor TaxID=45248 RepID=UPI0003B75F8D|nr:hypothetical protein [Leucothrix mucor]
MDRDLPVLPATAFIGCLILAIFVYMHNVLGITQTPVSQITSDVDGKVWALYGDQLIRLPTDNKPFTEQSLSLAPYGIQRVSGEVIPLKNGGWLINKGGQQATVLDNVKRLLRMTEDENKSGQSSLLKCDARLIDCQPWGDSILSFDQPWGGLALQNGQSLINDPSRHKVYLVGAEGKVLDSLGGFAFPNEIQRVRDKYWVLDTNNNQLVGIKPDDDQLSRTDEIINFTDIEGIESHHRYPSHFQQDGSGWWLLSNDHNMAQPGLYRISDDASRYGASIQDASAFYFDGATLFLADYNTQTIKRIDPNTGKVTDVNSALFAKQTARLGEQVTATTYRAWGMIAAILALGIGLLVFAIRKSKPTSLITFLRLPAGHIRISEPDYPAASDDGKQQLVWMKPHEDNIKKLIKQRKYLKIIGIAYPALFALVIAYTSYLIYTKDGSPKLPPLSLFIGLILMSATLIIMSRMMLRITSQLSEKKIGVINDTIIVAMKNGTTKEIQPSDIFYTSHLLSLNGHFFVMQSAKLVFMDKAVFESYAAPIIQQGKLISPAKLLWLLLKK